MSVMERLFGKYLFLKGLSPKNELLKYFVFDDSGFERNKDDAIHEEFMERFMGDAPTVRELIMKRVIISYDNYQRIIYHSIITNYISALENAIDNAEKMN